MCVDFMTCSAVVVCVCVYVICVDCMVYGCLLLSLYMSVDYMLCLS